MALASRSFSERVALGGGAVATYSFGSLVFLPAVSVEWKPIDGLVVQGFVPVFMSAQYTFSNRVELGVRGDIAGRRCLAVRRALGIIPLRRRTKP